MDRVAAARERLDRLRRDFSAVEFLCVDCEHLRGADCSHPAVESYSLDPVTGATTTHRAPARAARSGDGMCGPEAALFDPKPLASPKIVAAKGLWNGFGDAVAIVVAGGMLALIVLG